MMLEAGAGESQVDFMSLLCIDIAAKKLLKKFPHF